MMKFREFDYLEYKNNILIHKSARLGQNISLQSNIVIGENVTIGDNCEISSFVSIGSHAEMPREEKNDFSVIIGNNVEVREFVTIHSGHTKNTVIKDFVYIMNHSHIAHDCTLNNKSVISAGVTLAGHVVIGEECFIGIEASVHQRTTIGDLTILGANSFAKGYLGPCLKYVGNPAKPTGINELAIKRSSKKSVEIEKLLNEAKELL